MVERTGRAAALLALASAAASGLLVAACTGTMKTGGGGGSVDGGGPAEDAGRAPVDGGATSDAGPDRRIDGGGAAEDGGGPPPDAGDHRLGVFVLSGHMGRTAVSCDDGRSWIHDRSYDDSVRCFTDGFDCDHHPGSSKGVTFGRGWFHATWGWGPPGSVRRSRDGVDWEPVLEDTTFGGIAFGQDRVLVGSRAPRWSGDDGETWNDSGDTNFSVWNVRRTGWVPYGGGRFVLVGADGGEIDVVLSSDGGETWWHPTSIPAGCGAAIQNEGGIVEGDGVILIVGGDGVACRSTDGGDTWTSATIGGDIGSHVVWTGEAFMVWQRGVAWSSEDGATWSSADTTPGDLQIGPVEVSPAGTFVAVRGGWQEWYDRQRFYRSTDGVVWEELGAGSYTGSHPVRDITFGYLDACP